MDKAKKASVKDFAFNSQELAAIIRVCRSEGVLELKFGDLQISLRPETPKENVEILMPIIKPSEAEISGTQKVEHERAMLKAELEMRAAQVDQLFITDPLKAEELIADGDLIDDADDNAADGEQLDD